MQGYYKGVPQSACPGWRSSLHTKCVPRPECPADSSTETRPIARAFIASERQARQQAQGILPQRPPGRWTPPTSRPPPPCRLAQLLRVRLRRLVRDARLGRQTSESIDSDATDSNLQCRSAAAPHGAWSPPYTAHRRQLLMYGPKKL